MADRSRTQSEQPEQPEHSRPNCRRAGQAPLRAPAPTRASAPDQRNVTSAGCAASRPERGRRRRRSHEATKPRSHEATIDPATILRAEPLGAARVPTRGDSRGIAAFGPGITRNGKNLRSCAPAETQRLRTVEQSRRYLEHAERRKAHGAGVGGVGRGVDLGEVDRDDTGVRTCRTGRGAELPRGDSAGD